MYKEFWIVVVAVLTGWALIIWFLLWLFSQPVYGQEVTMTASVPENPCNQCLKYCK